MLAPGRGRSEGGDLFAVIGLRFLGGHDAVGVVAVAPGADAAADHHLGLAAFELAAHLFQERDGFPIGLGQLVFGVAQQGRPVGGRAPGGAFKDEADAVSLGDRGVGAEVAVESVPALAVLQEIEGGEMGQVEAVVKDERGLDAAVGEVKVTG